MSEEKFIKIIPDAASHRSLDGINFTFEKVRTITGKEYIYLRIGIGAVPKKALNLIHRSRVVVSYSSKSKYVLQIKKVSSKDEKSYALTSCRGNCANNFLLRLKLKWEFFIPSEKWFERTRIVRYKISDENTLIVYLNK